MKTTSSSQVTENHPAQNDVGGTIQQRQKGFSILRMKIPVGHITSEKLPALAKIAKKYGRGEFHLTTRQGLEISWISTGNIPAVKEEIAKLGFNLGASGPRVRVITACPGNLVCKHGIINAQQFGRDLDAKYFGADTPHKFKIAVAGCPNSCTKPRENDVGFAGIAQPGFSLENCIGCKKCLKTCKEGAITFPDDKISLDLRKCIGCGDCITGCPNQAMTLKRSGFTVYAGGKMGRHPVLGHKIAEFIDEETALAILDRCLAFYRREGKPKERFGETIQRVGLKNFRQEIGAKNVRVP